MSECLFCKIVNGEIPADVVYENDKILAFKDIHPLAPIHILVIPKVHLSTLNDVKDYSVITDIFKAIDEITGQLNIKENGYRVVCNCNYDGGQAVFHLHFHILAGTTLTNKLG